MWGRGRRRHLGLGDAVEADEDEADAGEEVLVVVVGRSHGGWADGGGRRWSGSRG
jgi:hypothetical protein